MNLTHARILYIIMIIMYLCCIQNYNILYYELYQITKRVKLSFIFSRRIYVSMMCTSLHYSGVISFILTRHECNFCFRKVIDTNIVIASFGEKLIFTNYNWNYAHYNNHYISQKNASLYTSTSKDSGYYNIITLLQDSLRDKTLPETNIII